MNFIDQFIGALALGSKQALENFCKLETSENDYSLLGRDGSLISLIKINGSRKIVGAAELNQIVSNASVTFAPYLEEAGHGVQFWFSRDPEGAVGEVAAALARAEKTSKALGLALDDVFSERKKRLPNFLSSEALYIALWSRPVALTKTQIKEALIDSKKKSKGMPLNKSGQRMMFAAESLRTRHQSFIRSMVKDLRDMGLLCDMVEVHEALKAVRSSIYPDLAQSQWSPLLPGDKMPSRLPENGEKRDVSSLLWPSIAQQIFVKDAENLTETAVRIGDFIYSGVDLIVGPEEVQPFSHILARLADANIPWRVSFLLEGAGLNAQAFKGMMVGFMAWASDYNQKIHEALKELKAMRLEGETIVQLRVSFATWAPVGEERKLRERNADLMRAVEGWGHCQATDRAGDPLEGVMSSALGIACASTAPPGAAPIADAMTWLPWGRPANPWEHGAVLLRTADGKPWPYQPGSAKQISFFDIVFAPPGYGKSVLMNTINLAVCLAPSSTTMTNPKLPRVAIIDVGPSSSGLVELIKESLPPKRRHEVAYHRLQMTPEYAINPFDTQLGCRAPMPQERSFIVNILILLATPVGSVKPYDGITDLVGIVVDELFKMFGDEGQPRLFARGDDVEVDEALDAHNIHLPTRSSWWEVVDILSEKELWTEAGLAQRHAVPLLHDVVVAARTRAVEDLFGDTKAPTGENIVTAFARMISGAIREFPILASPTRFDIGGARICALDLDEVAPRGGEAADRQTAIMYMLARHALARDFYLNQENVKNMNKDYRGYHMRRARELRETPKRLVYDEFHRTGSAEAIRAQVRADIREGRKWGIQICLASQLLDDFDSQMVDQATGIWILGAGTESAVNEAVTRFNLSSTSTYVLRHRLTGPSSAGAPMLTMLRLKDGTYEQFLYNTLGPIELWSLSTTAEDSEIRKRLYARIGPVVARARLAAAFPGGSAKGEIERRVVDLMEGGDTLNEDKVSGSVLDSIVDELASLNLE